MQLVAYGAQDVYLTGSPQITFFKLVYRRHTNFAVESIEQTFNGSPGFGKKASATISRNGDLITNVFLQVEMPSSGLTRKADFMHKFLESCEIEIGGQRIDKHYSQFYDVCHELMTPEEKKDGYDVMTGNVTRADTIDKDLCKNLECTYYLPLRFWFNNNPGLALPLIALQYHEVKLQMSFAEWSKCHVEATAGTSVTEVSPSVSLWVDYVYLDTDERRRFAQASHEYLIEQLQFTGTESISTISGDTSTKVRLNFNHPTKELIWFVNGNTDDLDYGTDVEYVKDAKLLLNGHDRFTTRPGSYFRLVVPFLAHTCVPEKHIYCYSFAIKPEEHQPSGSCNMSRIDSVSLHLTLNHGVSGNAAVTTGNTEDVKLYVYALSYNILRIVSGMGGLAYSN
jgi:hypothetical protein